MTLASSARLDPQQARRHARLGGLLYLAIIGLGLFGEVAVRGALVLPGDAAATASNIAASPLLWRAGIAGDLLMQLLDLPVMLLLYLLLKPVHARLALLATGVNLIQTAVLAVNKLNLLLPLLLLDRAGASALSGFSAEQAQALAALAIRLHGYGFGLGLLFFGLACLLRAPLLWRAAYLPRLLGPLMAAAGLAYLINSAALLLAPALADALFPAILAPAFVGELALALWLLIKGVDRDRWAEARP
ncbi:DUF4386 domain-containing protein [Roseateles violae]|uniref:DUF4386 domain-containing protein n=1 Tax=Roseateles violae TaxID=3058042 RepID=A0ABT8DSR0_9BURK|nr:DUF4386 domain-containing protein [Pelomonas sp. PFR6]MDN3921217.1 DUF4386 domain-containing protein [Pelomonas sp. PFR6]